MSNAETASNPIYPFDASQRRNGGYSTKNPNAHCMARIRARNVSELRSDHVAQVEIEVSQFTSKRASTLGFGMTLDAAQARALALSVAPEFAGLIDAAKRVAMIPSPVGTGYVDGSPEDRAYIAGFMYALKLVREPNFAAGLDAALAKVGGAG